MINTLKEYENGGKIDVYGKVDQKTSDFKKIFACCDFFAKQGRKTLITPAFLVETIGNPDYETIYASLRRTLYWGKCPDFIVDGVWYEHEGYDETKDLNDPKKRVTTFCNMVTRGLKQSEKIIIEECGISRFYAKRNIYKRIHFEHQNITEVYIRTVAGLELLYKKGEG
jgi:hypothetical protein